MTSATPTRCGASFDGAEVVVHLAFLILSGGRETTRAINVEGTLNAFRAAADVGVKSFVYASSVAAYGFHRDNPIGMSEDWATRPADRLFYAQEKAELRAPAATGGRHAPADRALPAATPDRPGPRRGRSQGQHPDGARRRWREAWVQGCGTFPACRSRARPPLQVIHQDDVAEALRLCVVGAGAPGAYNIAADDVITGVDVAGNSASGPCGSRLCPSLPWPGPSRNCRTCPREHSGSRP